MTQSAVSISLRRLAQRPYTGYEIAQYLARRQYRADEIEATVSRLKDLGYLDDLEAALATVRYRLRHPRGRRLVAQELHRRGIDQQTIEAALENYDEAALALSLAERLQQQGKSAEAAQRALASRGFPPAAVRRSTAEWYGQPDLP